MQNEKLRGVAVMSPEVREMQKTPVNDDICECGRGVGADAAPPAATDAAVVAAAAATVAATAAAGYVLSATCLTCSCSQSKYARCMQLLSSWHITCCALLHHPGVWHCNMACSLGEGFPTIMALSMFAGLLNGDAASMKAAKKFFAEEFPVNTPLALISSRKDNITQPDDINRLFIVATDSRKVRAATRSVLHPGLWCTSVTDVCVCGEGSSW